MLYFNYKHDAEGRNRLMLIVGAGQ